LAAFDSATIFYHAQVVAHVVAGCLIVAVLIARGPSAVRRLLARSSPVPARAWLAFVGAASCVAIATGLALALTGTATRWKPLLVAHIGSAVLAIAAGIGWQAGGGHTAGRPRVPAPLPA